MGSRPPSPSSRTSSPAFVGGYFSVPFERFARDETSDWAGAFTLLGMCDLYHWIHVYLLTRLDGRYYGDLFRLAHRPSATQLAEAQ